MGAAAEKFANDATWPGDNDGKAGAADDGAPNEKPPKAGAAPGFGSEKSNPDAAGGKANG